MLPTEAESPGLYGGFWLRFAALLADCVLYTVVLKVLVLALGGVFGAVTAYFQSETGFFVLMFGGACLYCAAFESSKLQATPAKYVLGLRVTDLDGRRIGFPLAVVRYVGKLLSYVLLCIGFLTAAFGSRKQALHDTMAGTLVVQAKKLPDALAVAPAATVSRRSLKPYILGAVAAAIVVPLTWIYLGAMADIRARQDVDGAIYVFGLAEAGLSSYYDANHAWPAQLADVDSDAGKKPVDKFALEIKMLSCQGLSCGVQVVINPEGTESSIAGRTIAAWTLDGGQTWLCGPGKSNPVEPRLLPSSCREQNPP